MAIKHLENLLINNQFSVQKNDIFSMGNHASESPIITELLHPVNMKYAISLYYAQGYCLGVTQLNAQA